MFTADFRPKNYGIVCENCIYYEKCPIEYICPTLNRIINEKLNEYNMEEQEE